MFARLPVIGEHSFSYFQWVLLAYCVEKLCFHIQRKNPGPSDKLYLFRHQGIWISLESLLWSTWCNQTNEANWIY